MKKMIGNLLLIVAFFLCCSWGFLVHRAVNQLAIYELPGELRLFFYVNMDSIVRNAPRPDIRRNTDLAEGPRHFIDLEAFGDSAAWKMPMDWNEAVQQYSKDSLLKYGYLPYHIMAIKEKLVDAFRNGNRDSIIYYAADLGHYIGDAHVPLHLSINYDGQLTNQRGIHDLWETSVPEVALEGYKLHNPHKAKYLDDPAGAVWRDIREAYSLLNEMFIVEKEISKDFVDSTKYIKKFRWGRERRFYSPAFARVYNDRLHNSINQQLLLSANLVADFWYTAWVDAGRPDLSSLSTTPFNKSIKKALKKECRAYRKNELIQKKLLIAPQSGDD